MNHCKFIRHRFLFALALPLLMLLVGCAEDDAEPIVIGGNNEITFNIGFAGDGQTRVATDADFRSVWEDGDAISIFATVHGRPLAESNNYIDNARLVYNSADDTWTLSPSDTPLNWPTNGITLDFYAYHPWRASIDPTDLPFTVKTDQNGIIDGRSSFNLSDMLVAFAEDCGQGDVVDLPFRHVMTMLQLTLDVSMIPVDQDNPPVVTLQGVQTSINSIGLGDPADINMYRLEQPGTAEYETTFTYRALVPPLQTFAAGTRLFSIESCGRFFKSEPLTSDLELEMGKAEKFTIAPVLGDYLEVIPDEDFKNYLLSNYYYTYDTNNDYKLSYAEMLEIKEIDLFMWDAVSSLEGIRFCKNLEILYCEEHQLTELDLTGLTKLKDLRCDYNPITQLDVSTNSALKTLVCGSEGTPELTVLVNPLCSLNDESNEFYMYIGASIAGSPVKIASRGVTVNGVTVLDKQP